MGVTSCQTIEDDDVLLYDSTPNDAHNKFTGGISITIFFQSVAEICIVEISRNNRFNINIFNRLS